jgi:hypothetical protein
MSEFFDFIEKSGLSEKTILDADKLPDNKLHEIAESLAALAPSSKTSTNNSNAFTFVANSEITGGRGGCMESSCRVKRAEHFAIHAALYADRVYIPNPFSEYTWADKFDEDDRYRLAAELSLIKVYKPLLEEGIISYCDEHTHYCNSCYSKFMNEFYTDYDKQFDRASKELIRIISDRVKFSVIDSYDYNGPAIEISSQNGILDHPMVRIPRNPTKFLLNRYRRGKKVLLKKNEVVKAKIYQTVSGDILHDWMTQDFYSKLYDASSLTNRDIDYELARTSAVEKDNSKNIFDLSHEAPFIHGASAKKVLALRKKNGEAFSVYRDAVNKALKESGEGANSKELLNDVVRPELNKIENTIKNSQKLLSDKSLTQLALGTSFIGIGLSTGFLPNNIAAIVAAVGGLKYATDLGENVRSLIRHPQEARNNPYYFLWKVQRLSKKK